MKILHLHNNFKWYDMIESGEKPEEYRAMYWIPQICRSGKPPSGNAPSYCAKQCPKLKPECREGVPTDYTHACIHRGYTKTNMLWAIDKITIGKGNPKWGAPEDDVVIIKLKERVANEIQIMQH